MLLGEAGRTIRQWVTALDNRFLKIRWRFWLRTKSELDQVDVLVVPTPGSLVMPSRSSKNFRRRVRFVRAWWLTPDQTYILKYVKNLLTDYQNTAIRTSTLPISDQHCLIYLPSERSELNFETTSNLFLPERKLKF